MVRFVLRIVLCEVFYDMTITWLRMTWHDRVSEQSCWLMNVPSPVLRPCLQWLCCEGCCSTEAGSGHQSTASLLSILSSWATPPHPFQISHKTCVRCCILGFRSLSGRWSLIGGSPLDRQKSVDKACCKNTMSSWWLFDLALGGTSRGGCRLHCWSSPLPLMMHNLVFSLQSHCCATL